MSIRWAVINETKLNLTGSVVLEINSSNMTAQEGYATRSLVL